MKNINYSTILFSVFSPNVILSPVKNSINPIDISAKEAIKNKNSNNKKLFISSMSLSSLDTKNNIEQNKFYKTYFLDKINVSQSAKKINIKKPKLIESFYNSKPIKIQKKINTNRMLLKNYDIVIKPIRNKSYKSINIKDKKYIIDPYKQYLIEKSRIELSKRVQEKEMKNLIEEKKQKKIKSENNILNNFQGIDFSKQKKREFFLARYLKSKEYAKKETKVNEIKGNELTKKIAFQNFMKNINFEINEKKYLFLENDEFIPHIKYSNFNVKLRSFFNNLKKNPNYNSLINYIYKYK